MHTLSRLRVVPERDAALACFRCIWLAQERMVRQFH